MVTEAVARNPYHLIDGPDDVQHFVKRDMAIAISVVQLEGPLQLVLHASPGCYAQGADEFSEVNLLAAILVKHSEDFGCEFIRVAVRKELSIYVLKVAFGESSRGAILDEAYKAPRVSGSVQRYNAVKIALPLYHTCSSFLSNLVSACNCKSSCCESFEGLKCEVFSIVPVLEARGNGILLAFAI